MATIKLHCTVHFKLAFPDLMSQCILIFSEIPSYFVYLCISATFSVYCISECIPHHIDESQTYHTTNRYIHVYGYCILPC